MPGRGVMSLAKKKVLVVCPSAAATSTFIAQKLRDLFAREGIDAETKICSTIEVESTVKAYAPDLVVSSSGLMPGSVGGTPIVQGLPFLTGIKVNETEREVLRILAGK